MQSDPRAVSMVSHPIKTLALLPGWGVSPLVGPGRAGLILLEQRRKCREVLLDFSARTQLKSRPKSETQRYIRVKCVSNDVDRARQSIRLYRMAGA